MPAKPQTVPVTDPAHPSHLSALEIFLAALRFATAIGPAVVSVADPQDAALAEEIGQIAQAGEAGLGQ